MRHVAIIGSGPAGYYTAEACQKQFGDEDGACASTSSTACPSPTA